MAFTDAFFTGPTTPGQPMMVSPMGAAVSAILPAVTQALGTQFGGILGPIVGALGSIPGLIMDYAAQQAAAQEANRQRMEAVGEARKLPTVVPLTPLASAFAAAADPRMYIARELAAGGREFEAQRRRTAEDMRSQMASRGIPAEQIEAAIREENRKQTSSFRDWAASVMERGRREVIDRLLGVTGRLTEMDQQRINDAIQNAYTKAGMLANLLLSPISTTSAVQSVMAPFQAFLQSERDYRLQRDALELQQEALRLQKELGWFSGGAGLVSSGMTLAGDIYGSRALARALSTRTGPTAVTTTRPVT